MTLQGAVANTPTQHLQCAAANRKQLENIKYFKNLFKFPAFSTASILIQLFGTFFVFVLIDYRKRRKKWRPKGKEFLIYLTHISKSARSRPLSAAPGALSTRSRGWKRLGMALEESLDQEDWTRFARRSSWQVWPLRSHAAWGGWARSFRSVTGPSGGPWRT